MTVPGDLQAGDVKQMAMSIEVATFSTGPTSRPLLLDGFSHRIIQLNDAVTNVRLHAHLIPLLPRVSVTHYCHELRGFLQWDKTCLAHSLANLQQSCPDNGPPRDANVLGI